MTRLGSVDTAAARPASRVAAPRDPHPEGLGTSYSLVFFTRLWDAQEPGVDAPESQGRPSEMSAKWAFPHADTFPPPPIPGPFVPSLKNPSLKNSAAMVSCRPLPQVAPWWADF